MRPRGTRSSHSRSPFIALPSVPPTAMAIRDKRIPNFQGSGYGIVLKIAVFLFFVLLSRFSRFWYGLALGIPRRPLPPSGCRIAEYSNYSKRFFRNGVQPYGYPELLSGPVVQARGGGFERRVDPRRAKLRLQPIAPLPGGHLDI
ncbi:hypothetical protein NMY22_g18522 [Coprinellus aureogranulatus]|nr:hypothetical protein NMY22_g18522 [Coprinellus aureogranulatus]